MWNADAYLLGTTLPLCQQIGGLSGGQQKLCMLYTDHMMHVGRGARRGIAECQFQFRNRKWNCSTVEDSTVFGPIISIRKSLRAGSKLRSIEGKVSENLLSPLRANCPNELGKYDRSGGNAGSFGLYAILRLCHCSTICDAKEVF